MLARTERLDHRIVAIVLADSKQAFVEAQRALGICDGEAEMRQTVCGDGLGGSRFDDRAAGRVSRIAAA